MVAAGVVAAVAQAASARKAAHARTNLMSLPLLQVTDNGRT
jgi:hypothetical protein